MTKDELSEILHEVCENVYDSITANEDQNTYPKIVYWSYVWEYVKGSGRAMEDLRTYQISVWGKVPPEQNPVLNRLRARLLDLGLTPEIRHEYVREDKAFHSFFALECFED